MDSTFASIFSGCRQWNVEQSKLVGVLNYRFRKQIYYSSIFYQKIFAKLMQRCAFLIHALRLNKYTDFVLCNRIQLNITTFLRVRLNCIEMIYSTLLHVIKLLNFKLLNNIFIPFFPHEQTKHNSYKI